MALARMVPDDVWARERVSELPPVWRARILREYDEQRASGAPDARRESNLFLLSLTEQLDAVRLPLGANDAVICDRAAELAHECSVLLQEHQDEPREARAAMVELVEGYRCIPPEPERINPKTGEVRGVRDVPAIKRMTDQKWWRNVLRRMHARYVEGAAIGLGYVNAARELYVSDESLARREQQNKRNRAMLENTKARNEKGDEYTLAQLADLTVSNPALRRGELMTRINGFEYIAKRLGHVGLFLTITCPSRMHKWKKGRKWHNRAKARPNPLYDGTTPGEAQKYLSAMWAKLRAKLAREGVRYYGFRIAEPNHDGTPHWHILIFIDHAWHADKRRAALPRVCAIVRRYALMDSPDEKGARHHRANFRPIDWTKGTAAGYIAKYISKNIDGYKVDRDLLGNDAIESSARVRAWAATWRIKQFSPLGGPPVGVWREMRKVEALPADAPQVVVDAHDACNKVKRGDDDKASVSWEKFVTANGGVFATRDERPIKLAKEWDSREGRYGEPVGYVVRGVRAMGFVTFRDGIVPDRRKLVTVLVESVRHAWEIVSRRVSEGVHAGIARTWTRVNNCTRGVAADMAEMADWVKDYERNERYGGFAAA